MIEWMQTHRKWLVITIWIATIAFIGAGFVGWGQVQLARKANVVATIKDTTVTIQDVQSIYQNLYSQYNKAFGGKLDEATAKKLGLDKMAMQQAIQRGVLLQYAKDLDLKITDKELAEAILKTFGSKKDYENYLKATNQYAKDFENSFKKELLTQKLFTLLNLKPSKTFTMAIASALLMADDLEIKVVKPKKVQLTEDEIKAYWEKTKNDYQTEKKYKINYFILPLIGDVDNSELKKFYEENKFNYKDDKGELLSFEKAKEAVKKDYLAHKLRKEAILKYKNLRKADENIEVVSLNNSIIPADKMETLIENGYLKPFIYNNAYVSARLIEEIAPKPMSYKEARELVIKRLEMEKQQKELEEIAKKDIKNFKGKKIGFITKYDFDKLPLKTEDAVAFIKGVFVSPKKRGAVILKDKVVLYNILAQKLLDESKYKLLKNKIDVTAKNLLDSTLIQDLIKELMVKYKIEVIKG